MNTTSLSDHQAGLEAYRHSENVAAVSVVDENGNNYGSWVEWASFKRHFVRKLASRIDTVKLFLRH